MWAPAHQNPSPTTPAIYYHICHFFIFVVSSLFGHLIVSAIDDYSVLVDTSMEVTSASASSSMPYEHPDATTRERTRTQEDNSGIHPSTTDTCYQVFINHRGPDVKNTLASIIHHCLQSKGLRVFLDKDEFQPGQPLNPTIEDAIRTSSVHIAIFSKRYAESDWCLKELCLMLETRAPIIPVFYDVRPNDLRWIEKGEYASAFNKHQQKGRFDCPTISAWKAALQKVSYVSGLDLQDPNKLSGDWGQLLKSLEDTVSQKLKPVPLEVATDPVGLDEAIRDFGSFMEREQQNEKVKIVGIVGLGGAGKTTLATEIFNRRRPLFQRSSFLSNLRDASNRNALPALQSKLLQDLLRDKDCKIDSVPEGRGIIKRRLQCSISRVLIVLDDVDDASQVEDLGVKDVLASGSLIIITSRDVEPLKLLEASIYKIKALSSVNAQVLFCKHAFRQPYPMVGFEDLAKKFCEKCCGLPLFLKVMGGHLRSNASNDKKLWEDELQYIPNGILNIIDYSYNALRKEEKHIFLDIACFFLGEDKDLAIKVWDTCERRGFFRLNILLNKCLVELDHKNCFKMHDHVRDFGRAIANNESPCRVWSESQAAELSEQAKATKATKEVRGMMPAATYRLFRFIVSCRSTYKPTFEGIDLSALKFLAINGDCIDEQIGGTLKNLVWLRWFDCPHENIPPWLISMKNLTVLEFIGGMIKVWPLRGEQVHLRELRIVGTNLSMTSTLQNVCSNLEHLDLHSNLYLKQVKPLPQKLVKLNLKGCHRLQEVQSLEHLPQLRDFDISNCHQLRELPKLQHLPSLETLNACACTNLQHLQGLEGLLQLRNLNICHCSELRELSKLQHLSFLETLYVSDCTNLQHIQGLEDLIQLRDLDISRCFQLRKLPKLQHLPSLEKLDVSYCTNLQHIQGLEDLPRLRNLNIRHCSKLRELPKLQHLSSLETLDAFDCTNLQHIQGLEDLPRLQNLNIRHCSELRELPKLQHLPSLETLDVSDCTNLQDIQSVEDLPQLRNLNISGCSELRELPKLQHLPSLETLNAFDCTNLQHIQGLEGLLQLRNLNISACSELHELPNLQHLLSLERLHVINCAKLQGIQGLEHLPQLRVLEISCCHELQEFPNLAHVISLEEVTAEGCWKQEAGGIQGLDQLEKLKSLTLSADDRRAIWNVLEHMKKLPESMVVRVKEVNSRDIADLSIIDLNIQPRESGWELVAGAGEENRGTCFMLCFVVQFPTMQVAEYVTVLIEDKNRRMVGSWEGRMEEGEWVCTVIFRSIECDFIDHPHSAFFIPPFKVKWLLKWLFKVKWLFNVKWLCMAGRQVKRAWMASGSQAKILEAAKKLLAP